MRRTAGNVSKTHANGICRNAGKVFIDHTTFIVVARSDVVHGKMRAETIRPIATRSQKSLSLPL